MRRRKRRRRRFLRRFLKNRELRISEPDRGGTTLVGVWLGSRRDWFLYTLVWFVLKAFWLGTACFGSLLLMFQEFARCVVVRLICS